MAGDIKHYNAETEIRFLSSSHLQRLGDIMSIQDDWKILMAAIPRYFDDPSPKFSLDNIASLSRIVSSTDWNGMSLLIHEWGDMSMNPITGARATLGYLLHLCLQNHLLRAADYISHFILGLQRILPDSFEISKEVDSLFQCLSVSSLSLDTLRQMTQDFGLHDPSFKIGSGGYSDVFKGITTSGKLLAVKRLKNTEIRERQFNNELEIIPSLHHENIIQVLAYSNENPNILCLVYPFMAHGSLEDKLAKDPPCTWKDKFLIARGIINGIVFLHDGTAKELIHRDIKTANILIDSINSILIPKIIDFGFLYSKERDGSSQEIYESETIAGRGTSAYMAPEVRYNVVHSKLDVFSYGVILLELISGLKALDENRPGKDLVTYVTQEIDPGSWTQIIDVKSGKYDLDQMTQFYELAHLCIEHDYKIRPRSRVVKDKLLTI